MNGIFEFIVNAFSVLTARFAIWVLTPLFEYFNSIIPNFYLFVNDFNYFFLNYIVRGVSFAREVLFNVTGYPRAAFNLLLGFYASKYALMVLLYGVRFIKNAIALVFSGRTANKLVNK